MPVSQVTATSPRTFTATNVSQLALASNPARTASQWTNSGANAVFLGVGRTAVVGSDMFLAANGGAWDGLLGGEVWTGAVYVITSAGSTNLCVVEV